MSKVNLICLFCFSIPLTRNKLLPHISLDHRNIHAINSLYECGVKVDTSLTPHDTIRDVL